MSQLGGKRLYDADLSAIVTIHWSREKCLRWDREPIARNGQFKHLLPWLLLLIITRRSWARDFMFLPLTSGLLCTKFNARWCRCAYQAFWPSP